MSTRSAAISFLDALARCCQSIGAETQLFLTDLKLPPVARPDDPQAQGRWFSQFMSDRLQKLYRRPCDDVVGALTAVALDLPSGAPGAETVRGRRRMASGKIKPKIDR
jgi:hypothetical protein